MTDEREKTGNDARVADVYRELADERPPRHLDDKVLRMAAREGRTRYSLVRGWMRPLTWAATIALSLAIVLELTLFSGMDSDYARPAATEPLTGRSEANEMAPEQAHPARLRQDAAAVTEEEAVLADDSGTIGMRSLTKRSRGDERDDADDAPRDASALVPQAVTIVRDAEELARAQAGADQPEVAGEKMQEVPHADTASSPAFAAPAVRAEAVALELGCSADERRTADSWHACIERLREEGLDEIAHREDEAFTKEHPAYRTADGDR